MSPVRVAAHRSAVSPEWAEAHPEVVERFHAKYQRTDGCWHWTAAVSNKGYGRFRIAPVEEMLAHRFAWQLVNGPIPEGMYACHRCDNPLCVNPGHIFVGPPSANVRDMVRKGRSNNVRRGEAHPGSSHSNAYLRGLYDAMASSGLSGRQFALRNGLGLHMPRIVRARAKQEGWT